MSQINWARVTEKANTDEAYQSRLKLNAKAACREVGCEVPDGTEIEVIDCNPDAQHLILGAKGYSTEIDAMLDRAVADAAFKQLLLEKPNATVEAAIGEKLPDGFDVVIHEKRPGRVFLFLSAKESCEELSDQELATVAGGTLRGVLTRIGNSFCPDNKTRVVDFGTNTTQLYVDPSIGGAVPQE